MRIGRIKVIFTFPQQIIAEHSGNMTFTNLPQEFLAYVEWYTKLQPAAEKNHLMYKISKPPPHADESLPNYSCAYDSLFVILYDIWIQDPKYWSREFRTIGNQYIRALDKGFKHFLKGELSLEDVRDNIRLQLHDLDPTAFPMGQMGASVGRLAAEMLRTNNIVAASQHVYTNCDFEGSEEDGSLAYHVC